MTPNLLGGKVSRQLQKITHSKIPEIREKLLESQGGICPICKKQVDSPSLDHKHAYKTKENTDIDGLVRKTLCRGCNRLVGLVETGHTRCKISYEELPEVLRNIADFLENQPYTDIVHPKENKKIFK